MTLNNLEDKNVFFTLDSCRYDTNRKQMSNYSVIGERYEGLHSRNLHSACSIQPSLPVIYSVFDHHLGKYYSESAGNYGASNW